MARARDVEEAAEEAVRRWVIESPLGRFAAYGLIGWCGEVAFTGVHDFLRTRDLRLHSRSNLWMFPIYGLLQPLFEPLHDGLRRRGTPWPLRGAAYGALIFGVEYATGSVLRGVIGQAPWDYTYAKRHLHGLIRFDYLPIWAAVGLAMERVHDRMTGR
jgi:uncharacterized membrane protein